MTDIEPPSGVGSRNAGLENDGQQAHTLASSAHEGRGQGQSCGAGQGENPARPRAPQNAPHGNAGGFSDGVQTEFVANVGDLWCPDLPSLAVRQAPIVFFERARAVRSRDGQVLILLMADLPSMEPGYLLEDVGPSAWLRTTDDGMQRLLDAAWFALYLKGLVETSTERRAPKRAGQAR